MNLKRFSRVLALLLALCALMSLSVFAVEGEGGIEPHMGCNGNHTWVTHNESTTYTSLNGTYHQVTTTWTQTCSVCGVMETLPPITKDMAHSFKAVTTGNVWYDYDNGVKLVEYYDYCSKCGYESLKYTKPIEL